MMLKTWPALPKAEPSRSGSDDVTVATGVPKRPFSLMDADAPDVIVGASFTSVMAMVKLALTAALTPSLAWMVSVTLCTVSYCTVLPAATLITPLALIVNQFCWLLSAMIE